ncbi:MAG: mechanosensitive ion channel [Oceanospirillaceae bacterium]|nr:mechanosensitive ion channel [Oceanospirillaceae bacterium]MCP5349553.1 mechanosensitive ion channel [Oceanospirillaceae bacterium]
MHDYLKELIHNAQLDQAAIIHFAGNLLTAVIVFFVGRLLAKIVVNLIVKTMERAEVDATLIKFSQSTGYVLLLLFVLLAALDKLGVNTASLIALVGAAGLAIGLALKDSLQNFSAGIMLLIFRPFRVGDGIEVAGVQGKVEVIGSFSTTILTGDNRQITIPNGTLYADNIINYSAKSCRRIDMIISIGYQDDIRKARDIIEALIRAEPRVLAEPEHLVAVAELADNSVNFVVRPWVKTEDYWPVRYALTEQIKLAFDEHGISIPYPQMDVHIKQQ